MRVTICGPNLRDQSKGQFHVHAADCADLVKGARREPEYANGWTVDGMLSRANLVREIYQDMMDESDDPDDWEAYDDLHVFPCCGSLAD